MRRYKFSFRTEVVFGGAVREHYFKIRCLPYRCAWQTVEDEDFCVSPCENLMQGRDVYGNEVQYGHACAAHERFSFASRGEVVIGQMLEAGEAGHIFTLPTALTTMTEEMRDFLSGIEGARKGHTLDRAMAIAEAVNKRMEYRPKSTGVRTTAGEAFASGGGVCQDFAHAAMAMMREEGIACRYVSGLMGGEGATHAWTEVNDDGMWYSLDPTHNRLVDTGYMKIAHGRDFGDCPVDKGVFCGEGDGQRVEVEAKLEAL